MATLETAFVTGAGSGIGRAIVARLLDAGAAVYALDVRPDGLDQLKADFARHSNRLYTDVLDVADRPSFEAAAARALDTLGHMDAVFNNAGVSLTDPVEQMREDDARWLFDINFWGVVTGTQLFLPHMKKRGQGHIVNISSIFGHIGVPTQSAYCAAKHAVKGFNESLHYELAGTGVQVHSVHPGGVDTGIVRHGRHRHTLEGDTSTQEADAMFKHFFRTTPDEAANTILNGVEAGQYHILVGSDARRMYLLQRLVPSFWRRLLARKAKQASAPAAAKKA